MTFFCHSHVQYLLSHWWAMCTTHTVDGIAHPEDLKAVIFCCCCFVVVRDGGAVGIAITNGHHGTKSLRILHPSLGGHVGRNLTCPNPGNVVMDLIFHIPIFCCDGKY